MSLVIKTEGVRPPRVVAEKPWDSVSELVPDEALGINPAIDMPLNLAINYSKLAHHPWLEETCKAI
jgi:hypothetical protein